MFEGFQRRVRFMTAFIKGLLLSATAILTTFTFVPGAWAQRRMAMARPQIMTTSNMMGRMPMATGNMMNGMNGNMGNGNMTGMMNGMNGNLGTPFGFPNGFGGFSNQGFGFPGTRSPWWWNGMGGYGGLGGYGGGYGGGGYGGGYGSGGYGL